MSTRVTIKVTITTTKGQQFEELYENRPDSNIIDMNCYAQSIMTKGYYVERKETQTIYHKIETISVDVESFK